MTGARPGVGVAVLLVDQHKRVLLGKRKGSFGAGTWGAPGGHVEHGERSEHAALRELMEEAGIEGTLDPAVPRPFIQRISYSEGVVDGRHYVTLHFRALVIAEDTRPKVMEPAKCEEWRWVSWKKPDVPVFGLLDEFMDRYPNPRRIPTL